MLFLLFFFLGFLMCAILGCGIVYLLMYDAGDFRCMEALRLNHGSNWRLFLFVFLLVKKVYYYFGIGFDWEIQFCLPMFHLFFTLCLGVDSNPVRVFWNCPIDTDLTFFSYTHSLLGTQPTGVDDDPHIHQWTRIVVDCSGE